MLGILVWFLFLLPKNLPFCLGKYVNTGKCVYVGRETSRDERKKKKVKENPLVYSLQNCQVLCWKLYCFPN